MLAAWLAAWLVGIVPAALLAYRPAKRDGWDQPSYAAAFAGFAWPLVLLCLAILSPFVLLARLVRAVHER